MTPPLNSVDFAVYKLFLRYLIVVQKSRIELRHVVLTVRENPRMLALYGTLAGGFVIPVSIPVISYILSKR